MPYEADWTWSSSTAFWSGGYNAAYESVIQPEKNCLRLPPGHTATHRNLRRAGGLRQTHLPSYAVLYLIHLAEVRELPDALMYKIWPDMTDAKLLKMMQDIFRIIINHEQYYFPGDLYYRDVAESFSNSRLLNKLLHMKAGSAAGKRKMFLLKKAFYDLTMGSCKVEDLKIA